MKLTVKLIGVFLLFLSVSFLGYLKAYSKREYIKRLKAIKEALIKTENMLKTGVLSRKKILTTAFNRIDSFICYCDGAVIDDKAMNGELKKTLESFFYEFGRGNMTAELTRIDGIKEALSCEISLKESEYNKGAKLWRTSGVCAGLAIGIMLI
ncbi:MAG: hypothetical protein J5659_00395 [Clostridia bacterium]|nr:hypothetical protein [Clostridia bacterium]